MEIISEHGGEYRVEVSGWDASECFFVEKTTLHWGRELSREIALRSTLRAGGVVFVRLIQPLAQAVSFPIAYQATEIAAKNRSGFSRVKLDRIQPREKQLDVAHSSSELT
jgi:hypothetical protein